MVSQAFRTFANCNLIAALLWTAVLLLVTQLPWLASWITTDWLGGLGILALITFWFTRSPWTSAGLLSVVMFSAAAATSNLFVLIILTLFLVPAQYAGGMTPAGRHKALWLGAALATSATICISYNLVVNRSPALVMGSSARLFNKLVDKGLAYPYLERRCRLGYVQECAFARDVSSYRTPEEFLWGNGVTVPPADREDAWMDRSRRYQSLDRAIILGDPTGFASAALSDAWTLAGRLTLSDAGRDLIYHPPSDAITQRIAERFPDQTQAFQLSRQQRGTLQSAFPSSFYAGVTVLSYLCCFAILLLAHKRQDKNLKAVAGIVMSRSSYQRLFMAAFQRQSRGIL